MRPFPVSLLTMFLFTELLWGGNSSLVCHLVQQLHYGEPLPHPPRTRSRMFRQTWPGLAACPARQCHSCAERPSPCPRPPSCKTSTYWPVPVPVKGWLPVQPDGITHVQQDPPPEHHHSHAGHETYWPVSVPVNDVHHHHLSSCRREPFAATIFIHGKLELWNDLICMIRLIAELLILKSTRWTVVHWCRAFGDWSAWTTSPPPLSCTQTSNRVPIGPHQPWCSAFHYAITSILVQDILYCVENKLLTIKFNMHHITDGLTRSITIKIMLN